MPFYGGTNDWSAQAPLYVYPTGPKNIIVTGGNEVILTAGSDLNKAAVDSGARGLPWPKIIDLAVKFFNSWKPNSFKNPTVVKRNGNYGSITSLANWGFRGREFDGVGNMPGPVPVASRPTYDNLTPIVYGLRDLDPNSMAQMRDLIQVPVIQVGPTLFEQGGNASLTLEKLN